MYIIEVRIRYYNTLLEWDKIPCAYLKVDGPQDAKRLCLNLLTYINQTSNNGAQETRWNHEGSPQGHYVTRPNIEFINPK